MMPYAKMETGREDINNRSNNTASSHPIANRRRRLLAMLIDTIGIFILAIVAGIAFAIIESEFTNTISEAPSFILGAFLYLLYYIPQEALTNRTLGKLIAGTRIQNTTNDTKKDIHPSLATIGFRRATIRTLARLIPGDPLTYLFNDEPVGWHDRIASTEVVRIK